MGSVFFITLIGKITRNEPNEDFIFFDNKETEVELPKKHVRFNMGSIVIPKWLAMEKELIMGE